MADDTTSGQFEREPLDVGFTMVPHGLWTADLPTGARLLLGWLHSHTDAYLAHLTLNGCREAFRTSSVTDWLGALEVAGFIEITRPTVAKRATRFRLLAKPWQSLDRQPVSRNRTTDRTAETGLPGKPKPARVVDHVEDQSPPTPHDNSQGPPPSFMGRKVLEIILREARKQQTGSITNPKAWEDAVKGNWWGEHGADVERLAAKYPDAPADVIAGAALGESSALRLYQSEDDGLAAALAHMAPEARAAYEDDAG